MGTRILAIETSCDETAAAVIEDGRHMRSNVVASQIAVHAPYGGVFPEMASRAHIEAISWVIQQAMDQAGARYDALSAVAVTRGPGLPGSLAVGVNAAKGICLARSLPLVGVNHLEGHIYSHWLDVAGRWPPASTREAGGAATSPAAAPPASGQRSAVHGLLNGQRPTPTSPFLALIVSGGHTELVVMRDHGQYELVGHTVDDAAGEAFDKVARMLGLGYPGGPEIARIAADGDSARFALSRPRIQGTRGRRTDRYDGAYDFSFSGAKTAVLHLIESNGGRTPEGKLSVRVPVADIASSFQAALVEWLVASTLSAAREFGARIVLVGGGVSANRLLRERMSAACAEVGLPVSFPPMALCTDNAAMIGAAAHFAFERGARHPLDMDVEPDLKLG